MNREFIGVSKKMKDIVAMTLKVSEEKNLNVMITGENGTGKEIIAHIIHYSSPRQNEAFYPINSAAIPESLVESEFFGHKKGTFTGAIENKKGCFEIAHKGTLFLDEISEMPFNVQAKLLRAIEEKRIKPVGSSREVDVDFRVISATNSKPEELIEKKKLRIDLYHRLNTFMINLPPLRERKTDIEPLIMFFVQEISRRRNMPPPQIHKNVYSHLINYPFPGNVRELRNMIERAMLFIKDSQLDFSHFNINPMNNKVNQKLTTLKLEDNEKKLISYALVQSNFNNSQAARLLGISRDTLIRKKRKYNIKITDSNFSDSATNWIN